jgi:hypothetical protein
VVALGPEEAILYRLVAKERLLTQPEVDEVRTLVVALAEELGVSIGAVAAYARFPYALHEKLTRARSSHRAGGR